MTRWRDTIDATTRWLRLYKTHIYIYTHRETHALRGLRNALDNVVVVNVVIRFHPSQRVLFDFV